MTARDPDPNPPSISTNPTLDKPTAAEPAPTGTAHFREPPGTRIGPYRIIQLIGEGGFGAVYMAKQEQPVQRVVALKIIKLGMDTRQVVARFEQERQALAIMDHPHIARVFDAGATETGRPYFVMELVKGEPIIDYCDKNSLSVAERLDLFAHVCGAVQHAHTKGIIHRDLKPSNVLVALQDGKPSPKVIDFGIAKATSARLAEQTFFTEHRELIGTPEYMSPEQAEGSMDIDTRTDVYSLGVLLYELLTGTTPFSGRDLRSAAYGEIQRIIREIEPPVPSTRLSQSSDTIVGIAAKRHTEPRQLGSTIRGELDWIVMKAMEKDRHRRYSTADGLGMDIRRFLSGEPVVAAPPGAAYRVKKFVTRHRGYVIASGVVAAALVLGIVGTTMGLLEARTQRETAQQQAVRAITAEAASLARLAEAEATVAFLDEMLAAADPTAQGKDVTVRKVLDGAAKAVGERFADRPLVAARLHGTIGRTYYGLGVFDQGETHLRDQLRIRTAQLGPDHEDTCRANNDLALLLIKGGKFADAEGQLKEAAAKHERLFGRKHAITLQSLEGLATIMVEQGRTAEAEPLLRECLQARQAAGTVAWESVATMNGLATLMTDKGQFDDAEAMFEQALAAADKLGKKEHPFTLELRGNLAWMQYWAASQEKQTKPDLAKKRMERSRILGEETYQAKLRVLGEEHEGTLATMSNLCLVYIDLGMLDQAETLRRKDLAISERVLGPEHPDTLISLSNLGALLRKRGRFEDAVATLERAVAGTRRVFPADYEGLGFTLGWFGSCLSKIGKHSEAEAALLEARSIIVNKMGEKHPIAKQMALDLVTIYGAWDKAEPGKGYAAQADEWKAKAGAPAPDAK